MIYRTKTELEVEGRSGGKYCKQQLISNGDTFGLSRAEESLLLSLLLKLGGVTIYNEHQLVAFST